MNRTVYHIALIMMLFLSDSLVAQNYAVSGYIIDEETKETLIGASVLQKDGSKGVVSNLEGYFQFAGLNAGKHELLISHVGYESVEVEVEIVNKSLVLPDIRLKQKLLTVDEVSIVAVKPDQAGDREVETSLVELSAKTIRSIPTAGNDVFAAVKYLPGVDRTEPFSPLFSVRGGDPGENAVLLDGVMIYNPYHSSITTGIFNTQIIKTTEILAGGFGAEYGGRNSSVMYLSTKDGNSSELHGEFEPSTFHSKIFLEFPVGERGSGMISGRYFYDIFTEFILQSRSYFYDFNLSYTFRINPRNRISFKYFQSRDRMGFSFNTFYKYFGNTFDFDIYDDFELKLQNKWTNRAATVIHKWILNPKIFLRTQAYYSSHNSDNYSGTDFNLTFEEEDMDDLNFRLRTSSNFTNSIHDISLKSIVNIRLANFSTLRFGAEFNQYYFKNSAQINAIDQGTLKRSPEQWAIFAEDKLHVGPVIIRPGIRFSQYDNNQWYYEPRINGVLLLPAGFKLKAAWGTYYQYVISMNTNEVEMNQSVDYYFPLNNYKPSKSIHYIAGIEKRLNPRSILSLDVYYKDIESIYTFDINQTENRVLTLSDKLQQGRGDAYGAEFMLRGAFKNLSGWLSYGLSWANRQYPQLNQGIRYAYDYNRRHTVKMVGNYAITRSLEYNLSFTYLSGTYRSIEQITQNFYDYDPLSGELSFFPIWISNAKNTVKMPAIITLDMSIRKRLRSGFGKHASDVFGATESYLTVTIRNLTFWRRNIEYYIPIYTGVERWEGKYLPIGTNYLPSVGLSYTIKF